MKFTSRCPCVYCQQAREESERDESPALPAPVAVADEPTAIVRIADHSEYPEWLEFHIPPG